jgi:two-component system, NtrC family, sensor histidine kinase KinB
MTFRRRILIAMIPLFVLLVALGATGNVLIYYLGQQVDDILRENYDSVVYMRNLNEALERIDSSFQFALAGREKQSAAQYQENWQKYERSLDLEKRNITLPGERELDDQLNALSDAYRKLGDKFYQSPPADRDALYFGKGNDNGLFATFQEIKAVSGDILHLNEMNMKDVNQATKRLARSSLIWYGLGLACGIVLAVFLVGNTVRMIVYLVRAVTESAVAIGAGNLDQVVPITSDDELGQLASAFNTMARQLREYRQSHKAQLIRAQRTSQATIDSFPEPVLMVAPDRRVEMANLAARRLFGLPQWEANTTPTAWEPPEALRQPLTEALQEQREYVPEGFDKVIVLQEGDQPCSYLPRVLPIRDGSSITLGAAVLLEDVTRFRLLDEVKTNMVATVSHELKTPLTSIRLVLHLLLEESVGPLMPKQLELLVDARDNAERLLAMINNLLDLARLEQGESQLRLQPESPATLLRETFEAFRPRALDRGVDFTLEDPAHMEPVSVDKERMQHALRNLLENALAHTPTGGRIVLRAEAMPGHTVFSVADTGSGIPAEYIPMVFERHFRVPGDTSPGGSGLGLAIVREIVTAHGGNVECESCPGKRTVFRVSLPTRANPSDPRTAP